MSFSWLGKLSLFVVVVLTIGLMVVASASHSQAIPIVASGDEVSAQTMTVRCDRLSPAYKPKLYYVCAPQS